MSIQALREKIKPLYALFLFFIIASILVGFRQLLSLEEKSKPIEIENSAQSVNVLQVGPVIGSKSGKKYYFPWCGVIMRLKPANQIQFASIATARAAGFLPGNCTGLE